MEIFDFHSNTSYNIGNSILREQVLPAFAIPTTKTLLAHNSFEQHLCALSRSLREDEQATLLRFAEFLVASQQRDEVPSPPAASFPVPGDIQRPEEESVIMAIKRLTTTYPMINKDKLLHQTSELMAGHVMQGRAAGDVIDELEQLFAEHYQQLRNEFEQNC